jgi:hypothetical protein
MPTPGQEHDLTCAQPLLKNADPHTLIGDKAYDADSLIDTLNEGAIIPVIRQMNLVERFFNKIKCYQAITTRYDKLARKFLSAVQLVAAIILLN